MDVFIVFKAFGGLGLFLLGMNMMSDGLKRTAGDRLRKFLDKITGRPIKGLFVGAIVTMILQSSSATTVMVVGLVNASIMTVIQAAGVIVGTNIGTTITAQLIALNLSEFAPLFIAIGVFLKIFGKDEKKRIIADAILGFGLLFLGISIMSQTLKPLAGNPLFADILVKLSINPLLGLLAGAAITAIIQSSSASIGLLQALAIGGAFATLSTDVTLSITIPIILGMNIGTCITAILSTIGTNRNAKRVALIHLFVNIFGSVWVLILMAIMNGVWGTDNIVYNLIIQMSGTTLIDGSIVPNVSKQIANSHMLFNIANAIILLPFLKYLVKFIEKLLPEKESEEEFKIKLDDRLLENPTLAISETLQVLNSMGQLAYENFHLANKCFKNYDSNLIKEIHANENQINLYDKGITNFLVKITSENLTSAESELVYRLHQVNHNIERIGDHAEHIINLSEMKRRDHIVFSEHAEEEIEVIYNKVDEILSLAFRSMREKNTYLATGAKKIEESIDMLQHAATLHHIDRLNQGVCSADQGVPYLEYINDMERIADYAYQIAQFVRYNL